MSTQANSGRSTYYLKVIVVARLLAEITVLLLLLGLPAILFFTGHLASAVLPIKIVAFGLALIAACILPCYGFITYKVQVDDTTLGTCSLLKRQVALWENVQSLRLRSTWGFRRYVVKVGDQGQELSIPLFIEGQRKLLDVIRSRIPASDSSASADKTFKQHPLTLIFQIFRLGLNILFAGLFWGFFNSLVSHAQSKISSADKTIILCACLVLTLFIIFRCLLIIVTPKLVASTAQGLSLKLAGRQVELPWEKLEKVIPSMFPLPGGLILKTALGWFFVDDTLDGADELETELLARYPLKS